jgi:hypothetical protein
MNGDEVEERAAALAALGRSPHSPYAWTTHRADSFREDRRFLRGMNSDPDPDHASPLSPGPGMILGFETFLLTTPRMFSILFATPTWLSYKCFHLKRLG